MCIGFNVFEMNLSVEFFPPAEDLKNDTCTLVKEYVQNFPIERISITHGASGSKKDKSLDFIQNIVERDIIAPQKITAHLSCAGLEKGEVLEYASKFYEIGIRELLVIKGDGGDGVVQNGYKATAEAIFDIKKMFPEIGIVAACFPEPRQGVPDEILILKEKIQGGANRFISQFCFENTLFEKFHADLQFHNIKNEITIGLIIPSKQTISFAEKCWAKVPQSVHNIAHSEEDATEYVISQMLFLKNIGFNSAHLYSLNKAGFMSVIERYLNKVK